MAIFYCCRSDGLVAVKWQPKWTQQRGYHHLSWSWNHNSVMAFFSKHGFACMVSCPVSAVEEILMVFSVKVF